MEEKGGLNDSGVSIKVDEAPQRVENPGQNDGSTAPPAPVAPAAVRVSEVAPSTEVKKRRGRPRKYAPDGSVVALSPMPISASYPVSGDYTAWKPNAARPVDSFKKKHKLEFENAGGTMAFAFGGGFTPHVITVNDGEDISSKIISFSQQGSRAICILAANGAISNVTLRQPNSSGGTSTYEGQFEILSLKGSFILSDNGMTKSRSGGMSVSLAGPDGRVFGGGLAGMLVAAGSVQVVIGTFVPGVGQQLEQKPKKPKYEHTISFAPAPANDSTGERYEAPYHKPNSNRTTSASFHADNSTSINSVHGFKITGPESNLPMAGEDSRMQSHEITF